jgi:hypothetical protein
MTTEGSPATSYRDDPSISDTAILWRRIPPDLIVYDADLGRRRPKSQAFTNHRDGSPMSVVIATEAGGLDAVLAGHEGYALAAFAAGLARACGQGIARDPLADNPAHAVVFGPKTTAARRRLAREAEWAVPPPA